MPAATALLLLTLLSQSPSSSGEQARVDTIGEEAFKTPSPPVLLNAAVGVQVRSGRSYETGGIQTTDLEVDPALGGRFLWPTGGLTLVYDPRLIIVTNGPQKTVAYLHRARLNTDTALSPRLRFYVNGRGAYGGYDFLPLSTVVPAVGGTGLPTTGSPGTDTGTSPPTQIPNLGRVPDVRFLTILNTDASAGIAYSVSPTVEWVLSAGYAAAGGVGAENQAVVPFQQGPQATTQLGWNATRSDTLALLARGEYIRFSSGPHDAIVELTGTWTHVLSRQLTMDVTGGAGFTSYQSSAGAVRNDSALPVGGLGLVHSLPTRSVLWHTALRAVVAPAADLLNGTVGEWASAILESKVDIGGSFSFGVTGSASVSLKQQQQHDARVEVRGSYVLGPELVLSLGTRLAWLSGSTLLGAQGFGWLVFLDVASSLGTPL